MIKSGICIARAKTVQARELRLFRNVTGDTGKRRVGSCWTMTALLKPDLPDDIRSEIASLKWAGFYPCPRDW